MLVSDFFEINVLIDNRRKGIRIDVSEIMYIDKICLFFFKIFFNF